MAHRRDIPLSPAAVIVTALAALLLIVPDARAAVASSGPAVKDLCAAAVRAQEAKSNIPKKLLTAISLVESGRWDADTGITVAWPWTVTAEGKGRFFPTKAAAIAAVHRLQARGVSNIDVGCMQVNLYYHPNAFASLEDAFDPDKNAAYGAKFLTDLRRDQGSWQRAVQHYHSAEAERHIPYQRKVYAAWHSAMAETGAPAPAADTARMRRIGQKIDRDYRAKVSAFQRQHRLASAAAKTKDGDDDGAAGAPLFLSSWPPRDARAQMRAQDLARAWAFGGASRHVRP